MRPSPRWGCRQWDGQAAATENFAAACLPVVSPAAASCKSGQTEAVPPPAAAAATATKPMVPAAKVGEMEEEAAEKPKKKRPSRRGEAKGKVGGSVGALRPMPDCLTLPASDPSKN